MRFGLPIIFVALSAVQAMAWTVTSRNFVTVNAGTTSIAELSGVTYDGPSGAAHGFSAVQDSGGKLVGFDVSLDAVGNIQSAAVTTTTSLVPSLDFEGVALAESGTILVAEETTPAVRQYAAGGTNIGQVSLPNVYANRRSNRGLESLTSHPNGTTYWTANEEALTIDGPLANTSTGTVVRVQQFSFSSGSTVLGPQFAYNVDPIHVGSTIDNRTRSGLVDLVGLPDGSLLALERSLGIAGSFLGFPLYEYESRLYQIDSSSATDISAVAFDSGLSGASYTAATKTLLWSGAAGGNLEGLALGPQLSSGDFSLVGVVDNGGGSDPLSGNRAVALTISPPLAGDYNRDGQVDAADYTVWRDSEGSTSDLLADGDFSGTVDAADYSVWRHKFGQSSAASAGQPIPEPATIGLLACTLLGGAIWRVGNR